ncbi:MAG: transglycosylase SLT domain-containing protein [Deltaproteobacteria bacterium]|nr:transglycosylase SLT domain-containing protein [Deltaproteobacteria bacterium]
MDWLSKIPPMISALAFGYGLGMAAPEAAFDRVRAAVDAPGRTPHTASGPGLRKVQPPQPHAHGGYGATATAVASRKATRSVRGGADGDEAPELARLREVDGPTCKLEDARADDFRADRFADADKDDIGTSRSRRSDEDDDELDEAGREALSRLQLPDFRVAISRRALKYVRFLTRTNPGRDMFETWLKRSGRYQEAVLETLRERQLPEDLIWVAMIESGFDPRAKSPAGAVGLWQFMRSTGSVYGLEVDKYQDLRRDPVRATRAAAHHLKDLHQRFGSWDLALAAYNMGYEQLLDAIDRTGTTDFNELSRQQAIPIETANYVPKIVAAALVADNLELYGFGDVEPYKPLHVAELSVPGGVSLDVVARAAGIGLTAMRNFNPHLLGKFVPPGREQTLYIPADTLSRARAALPAMLDEGERITDADVLAPGDLVGLGGGDKGRDKFDTWNDEENRLSLLPKPKRRSLRSVLRGQVDEAPRADVALDGVADEFRPRRTDRETVMYRVGAGESLIAIAKQFAIDLDDLARDNGIDAEDTLREGTLLRLQVKRSILERKQRAAASQAASPDDGGARLELPKKRRKRAAVTEAESDNG